MKKLRDNLPIILVIMMMATMILNIILTFDLSSRQITVDRMLNERISNVSDDAVTHAELEVVKQKIAELKNTQIVNGKDGAKGEKGDTGATGQKGDKGDTGVAGKDGTDGQDGTNGTNGLTPMIRCNTIGNRWETKYVGDDTWTVLNGMPVKCMVE